MSFDVVMGEKKKSFYRRTVEARDVIREPQMQADAFRYGRNSYAWGKYVNYLVSKTSVQAKYKDYITQADAIRKKADESTGVPEMERMQYYLASDVYSGVAKRARALEAKGGVLNFFKKAGEAIGTGRIKGLEKLAALVFLALGSFFIYPSITGNVIGGSYSKFSIFGGIFFILAILFFILGFLGNKN